MRKYRQCPKCKSKKGFEITISRHGHYDMTYNFTGDVLDMDFCGADDIPYHASCLDCGEKIESDRLQLD